MVVSQKETKQRKPYSRISLYLTTKRKGWLSELRRCSCSVLSFGRRSMETYGGAECGGVRIIEF